MINNKRRGEKGQSLVETVLIFPLLLLLIMGIIQMTLLSNGKAVVNYAAFCAARAGAVEKGDRSGNISAAAQIACIPISERLISMGNNNLMDILSRWTVSRLKTTIEDQNIQNDSRFVRVRHHFGLIVPFAGRRFAYQPVINNLPVELLKQLELMDVSGLYEMSIPNALPVNLTSFAFEQLLRNPQLPIESRAVVMIDRN